MMTARPPDSSMPARRSRAVWRVFSSSLIKIRRAWKTLARDLYQMGLDFGLPPDEAALLTSETKLPTFISKEGEKEFMEGLVEAYQTMLDERLQSLGQKLGVG